jgi:hypothetical protein
MHGVMPPFPNTSSWRGVYLSTGTTSPAPSGRELYHFQFSLQAASPETFGYTLVCRVNMVAKIIPDRSGNRTPAVGPLACIRQDHNNKDT